MDKSKPDVHLFYSDTVSLENLHTTTRDLHTLVIIGQRDVTSLSAISELIQLRELWVVECGIKEVPPFKKNCKLEKLYLYSNEIECIPNLRFCLCLKSLFLSENNIRDLRNLNKLTWIQELNLANNKLDRISKVFSKRSELQYVNLAGNYLRCLKDIKNLAVLQKLNSVAFTDPLYGNCPLVSLCNYRFYVIKCLSHIKHLDHYSVCEEERHWVNHFHKKQIMYYNMILHKRLNIHFESLKERYKQYLKNTLCYREQFYAIKMKKVQICSKQEKCDKSEKMILQSKLNDKHFTECKEIATTQLKILQQQLILSINSCGNINFVEYNENTGKTIIKLCQQILEESLCSIIKNDTGINGVRLYRVTKVINKEIEELNVWQSEEYDLQSNMDNMILKVLASPFGVTDIQKWPLSFFKTELFTQKEMILTDCLAIADVEWLNETFFTQENLNLLNTLNMCQKRRVCVLVQIPLTTLAEKIDNADKCHAMPRSSQTSLNETCRKFKLMYQKIRNPMFVIEYEYTLDELTNTKLQNTDDSENCIPVVAMDGNKHKCLSSMNITQYLSDGKQKVHNLAKICISGQNINIIDTNLDLPNLRELDISYNQLGTFPNLRSMKAIKILNVSFNNISSLCIVESLPEMEELDISWNLLNNCLTSFQTLTACMPNICRLNIDSNPFQDVTDHKLVEFLAQLHLPKLQYVSNDPCKSCSTVQKNYFPCALNMCKLNNKQCRKLINLTQEVAVKNKEELTTGNKEVGHMKCIHISQSLSSVVNVLQKALKVQELCATCCLLTKLPVPTLLKYLTKLNLASNFISIVDGFTQENFPTLKYLDLTNNLITTLQPMGSFHTLQELYCGHNEVNGLPQIDIVKTWKMLRIIDLCNNPIDGDTVYKKFITFHLNNVKYISGECIQNMDIFEAKCEFGNILNKNMLHSIYKVDRLINITQLSVIDCSLTKVDLSADVLPLLESLDLSKNQITCLWGLHFFQCLHTLCLSYNSLETFDENSYEGSDCVFQNLCTLFLDHNAFKSLINVTKAKLPVIKHLFLNHNSLQSINEISQCSTLETLVLDYNKIEALNEEDFPKTSNIKFLSLENNRIGTLQFIKSLEKLERLYIANNCITNDSELEYLASLRNLEELTFKTNSLTMEINDDIRIIQDFELKNIEI